ncbi:hypothetical protein [Tropicimonas isoalkanivorans]|uniref:Uncharacterized protein n=1 Tax=Tropicimonas isoalkanivorans TaxID=441112 RepID=A0A1I1DUF4_9RHOB|nr:hypothetical protein [Tropicimonas isoalkanivorans]SFB76173.1 hypothetical protein SAMN04488094_101352 [Tropicimonas isoalkanivorans]
MASSPTKHLNLRARTSHHDILRRVNDRLKTDPTFFTVLRGLLDDLEATAFMPIRDLRAELHRIHARIDALEAQVDSR